MAQQTRIETVVPYFNRFIRQYGTVEKLARAPRDEVLRLWSGLGYYRRAVSLHEAARRIVENHAGRLPHDLKALLSLPGVGPYTAGAIASIAFDEPVPLVDGNVIRVFSRLFNIGQNIEHAAVRRQIWALGESLVPKVKPGVFNEGLMELGALICTPRLPDCGACPVRAACDAFAAGTVDRRPVRTRKSPPLTVRLAGAVLHRRDGAILLVQNPYDGPFGGLWLAPYFPVDLAGSAPRKIQALTDALEHLLGVRPEIGRRIGTVEHILTHRKLKLVLYDGVVPESGLALSRHLAYRWVRSADQAQSLALAAITQKVLKKAGL